MFGFLTARVQSHPNWRPRLKLYSGLLPPDSTATLIPQSSSKSKTQFLRTLRNRVAVFGSFHPHFDPLKPLAVSCHGESNSALFCGSSQIFFGQIQMFGAEKPQVFSPTAPLQPQPQLQPARLHGSDRAKSRPIDEPERRQNPLAPASPWAPQPSRRPVSARCFPTQCRTLAIAARDRSPHNSAPRRFETRGHYASKPRARSIAGRRPKIAGQMRKCRVDAESAWANVTKRCSGSRFCRTLIFW